MTRLFPNQHLDNAETSHLITHGLSSPFVNAPRRRAGKGSPEPHDTPVQPEEARAVIALFC